MIEQKIKQLNQIRRWDDEIDIFIEIISMLDGSSIREIAAAIGKSKSWVDKSMQLARGLRIWPYLRQEETRHAAYRFILKRKKQRK